MALAAAIAAPEAWLMELLFASLRPGAALALLPALGGQLLPLRVRIGLAAAIGWVALSAGAAPPPPASLVSLQGLLLVAGELMIGLVAALALHAAFAAALIAGDLLAQGMGLGFALTVDPGAPQAPVLATLLSLLGWSLFLAAGGHLLLIDTVVRSYAAMPDAGALFEPDRMAAVIAWGGYAFASGLMAALPLAAVLLMVNLAIGVAARSAPQLNLFAVGFPLLLLLGLAGLPLAMPGMADTLSGALTGQQQRLAELLLG